MLALLRRANSLQELPAIQFRHALIHQDKINPWLCAAEALERVGSILSLQDAEAPSASARCEKLATGGLVVDDEQLATRADVALDSAFFADQ